MKINYKFNKNSETRDCVVESVECTLINDLTLSFVDLGVLWKNGETKTFTSQQKLKSYINTIQEPIEFIAESDIDQVLMKEWINEWETEYIPFLNIRKVTGSPKLNSNWTFKIK